MRERKRETGAKIITGIESVTTGIEVVEPENLVNVTTVISIENRNHIDKKTYPYDYEEPKQERSHESRVGREGSKERVYFEESIEKHSSDRYRSRDYSYNNDESNRERSHEPRDRREGSRDERNSREKYAERSLLKRKERADGEDRLDRSDKRRKEEKERADSEDRLDRNEKRRKEEKRVKCRFEDKAEVSRDRNGTNRERMGDDWKAEASVKEEQMKDANRGSSCNGRRERWKFGVGHKI